MYYHPRSAVRWARGTRRKLWPRTRLVLHVKRRQLALERDPAALGLGHRSHRTRCVRGRSSSWPSVPSVVKRVDHRRRFLRLSRASPSLSFIVVVKSTGTLRSEMSDAIPTPKDSNERFLSCGSGENARDRTLYAGQCRPTRCFTTVRDAAIVRQSITDSDLVVRASRPDRETRRASLGNESNACLWWGSEGVQIPPRGYSTNI